MRRRGDWTLEMDDELRDLIEGQKLTYPQAGLIMGRTRNSIAGRCSRLGIHAVPPIKPLKPKPIPKPRIRPSRARKPPTVIVPQIPIRDGLAVLGLPRALLERGRRQCQFPLGDPREKDFGYCPNHKIPYQVYCLAHFKISRVAIKARVAQHWQVGSGREGQK